VRAARRSNGQDVQSAEWQAQRVYLADRRCTGRSSSDDVGIVSYWWQLGSIGTASTSVTTVSFKHNSTQNVTLTVTDAAGQVASSSQIIKVR
jgi:chitodextrinase